MRKYSGLVLLGLALVTMSLIGQEPPPAEKPAQEQLSDELMQIAALIRDLDSPKFEKRQQATEQLRRIGKPAVAPLKQLLAAGPSLEVATRVRGILRGLVKESKAQAVRAVLAKTIDLPDGVPANTCLKDFLDFLTDMLKANEISLNVSLDTESFKSIAVLKVEEEPVSLRPMVNVSISHVLREALRQVRGEKFHGTYVVRNDRVVVTTTWHTRPGAWAGAREFAPVVDLEFDNEPLSAALRQLADAGGINIVLDPRVAEKVGKLVTVTLNEVPVDTAARLLADMADLKAVALDNVLYVTSPANGQKIEAEQEKQKPSELPGVVPPEK